MLDEQNPALPERVRYKLQHLTGGVRSQSSQVRVLGASPLALTLLDRGQVDFLNMNLDPELHL
jgi:hypothetical protein